MLHSFGWFSQGSNRSISKSIHKVVEAMDMRSDDAFLFMRVDPLCETFCRYMGSG